MQGKTMYHQSTLLVVRHDLSMLGAWRDWSKAIFSDMSFNEIGQIIEGMMYWLGITGSLGGPQGFLSEGDTTKSQSTKSTHQSIFAIHVLFEETSLGKRDLCGCWDLRYGAAKTLSPAMQGKSLVCVRWSRDLRACQRENLILAGPPGSLSFRFHYFYMCFNGGCGTEIKGSSIVFAFCFLCFESWVYVLHYRANGMPKAPLEALRVEKNAFFSDTLQVRGPDFI